MPISTHYRELNNDRPPAKTFFSPIEQTGHETFSTQTSKPNNISMHKTLKYIYIMVK